jgi:excisionase family DNA binding protein
LVSTTTTRKTLSIAEASDILGVSRQLAYNLAKQGRLPGVKRIGGRYLVSAQKLEEFLASDEIQPVVLWPAP